MKTSFLDEKQELPLLVEPESNAERRLQNMLQWAIEERDWIEVRLLQYGALLLRGFSVQTPQDFEHFCTTIDPRLLDYAGGDSPREAITGKQP